jgi:hypothetical protein
MGDSKESTEFLLPTGIRVRGLTGDELETLKQIVLEETLEWYKTRDIRPVVPVWGEPFVLWIHKSVLKAELPYNPPQKT